MGWVRATWVGRGLGVAVTCWLGLAERRSNASQVCEIFSANEGNGVEIALVKCIGVLAGISISVGDGVTSGEVVRDGVAPGVAVLVGINEFVGDGEAATLNGGDDSRVTASLFVTVGIIDSGVGDKGAAERGVEVATGVAAGIEFGAVVGLARDLSGEAGAVTKDSAEPEAF